MSNVPNYWIFLKEIFAEWSEYNGKKKLYINATHPETYWRVAKVIEKYYGGKIGNIKKAERAVSDDLDRKLERFAKYCEGIDVDPVTREWLYYHVKDGKAAQSYKGKIDSRLNKCAKPVHPRDL